MVLVLVTGQSCFLENLALGLSPESTQLVEVSLVSSYSKKYVKAGASRSPNEGRAHSRCL